MSKVKTPRLFFIDNMRVFLIVLVVLHHAALVYGAGAPFYYVEPPMSNPLTFLALLVFILVNQSWFMGAFFLLSGYIAPGAFDRKGPGSFIRDRLLRLGIPLIVFIFVLNPVSSIGLYKMPASLTGITTPLAWQAYPRFLGIGPMWFVIMLLVFDFGYAAWRLLRKNRTSQLKMDSSKPGYLWLGIFILALAAVSYLVRMVIPMGKTLLGFPTLSYLPQYLGFFILGTVASRRSWFITMPGSMGAAGFIAAVLGGVFLFPLAFSGRLFSLELTPALAEMLGKGHWRSAVYALWDSIFAVGMCLGLITFFRRFFGLQGKFGRLLSQSGYGVYVFHIPVVVWLAIALKGINLAPLPKFGIAAVIMTAASFAASSVIRKIPGVSRIL